ncbi:MAG TPA: hypothetical protein VG013_15585 [Gemmataceae bacterium]|jgi:hypothetical protein|nr:hypothetical protein [Gemmataceae bacterium]
MATQLGKVLVVINLVLSLVLAGLALGIYTNRIDWSGPLKPVSGEAAQGELGKRKDEFQHWLTLVNSADSDWQQETAALVGVEKQRPADQKWYADQLDILEGRDRNGKDVRGPIAELAYDPKSGQLGVDNTGHPKLLRIPLQSRQTYLRDLASKRIAIDKEIEIIANLQTQQEALTLEINGVEGKQRGLRNLIAEAKRATMDSEAEVKYLEPLLINRLVEGQLLAKRRDGLEARVKLLTEKAGVSARRP